MQRAKSSDPSSSNGLASNVFAPLSIAKGWCLKDYSETTVENVALSWFQAPKIGLKAAFGHGAHLLEEVLRIVLWWALHGASGTLLMSFAMAEP